MIRSDIYTKVVLTVIAVCLVVLCMRSPVPAYAQSGAAGQRVVIAGFDAAAMKAGMPVWLAGGNGSIPVVITGGNTAVPVSTQGQPPLQVVIAK